MLVLRHSLCILACLITSQAAFAAKVNLLVENHPPYIEQKARQKGVITELVVAAFKRKRVSSNIQFANWTEVERRVDSDNVLSFMWNKTKPLLKKWHFSEPIYVQQKKFLAKQSFNRSINYLHNLRGLKIGLTRGMTYGSSIEQFRDKLSIGEFESDYATVKKLLDNQVELIAIEPMRAVYLVNQHFSTPNAQQLRFINTPHFEGVNYYVVCAKRYGNCLNHIKKFNQGLDMLQLDGTKKTLLHQAERLQ